MGNRCSEPNSLVWPRLLYGNAWICLDNRMSAADQLLHRYLQGPRCGRHRHCHYHPQHHELRRQLRVSYVPLHHPAELSRSITHGLSGHFHQVSLTELLIRRRITPWITNMGYKNAFLVAGFVAFAQWATFLIFIKWGKSLRRASAGRYQRYVEKVQRQAGAHL